MWLLAQLGDVTLPPAEGQPARTLTWHTLVPPFVALAAVLITRHVILSLVLALLAAGLLRFGLLQGIPSGFSHYVWDNITDPWHLYIAGFALTVLSTVKLTEASGGTHAIVDSVERLLRSARSVKLGTFVLGLLIFFDDYANSMLVGPSMRPLSDRYRVSRAKLAYIVDSTAAPIAGLALVSTWLGYEIGLLEQNTEDLQLGISGYGLLIQALPMRFYCVFCLVMVFFTSYFERDFGPMLRAELEAQQLGSQAKAPLQSSMRTGIGFFASRIWLNAALPMGGLMLCVMLGLFWDGGGFHSIQASQLVSLTYWRQVVGGIEHSEQVLFWSAIIAALLAVTTSLLSGRLDLRGVGRALSDGFRTGLFPLAILVCAWGLGSACKDLATGPFLVGHLQGALPATWVPLLTFVAAALVSLATGTSWGTMAILIPAAIPLAHGLGGLVLLLPTIAAVLDGAIFGDHCSPVSDTTLLSSAATDCDVLEHVWTQLPYALCAMAVAAAAYLLVATETLPIFLVYLFSLITLLAVVMVFGKRPPRNSSDKPL